MTRKIIDISLKIHENMQYYPGEVRFSREQRYSLSNGDAGNSTKFILSSHCGTHVDPFYHVNNDGYSVEQIKLEKLIGKCLVVDCSQTDGDIEIVDIEDVRDLFNHTRILFKLYDDKAERVGNLDINTIRKLSIKAAKYLISNINLKVVAIDGLSIGNTDTHLVLLENGCEIIEGLDLRNVKSGSYFLICLPLNIDGGDGAPARAVLLENQTI